jgi:autotransporter strand-loop-strand O-heptosyltransferase
VILLSKEGNGYMGNHHPTGITIHPNGPLENVIKTLRESEFFIGIGSGLSWLSWACEVPTVIISGFSEPYTETITNTVRIEAPEGSCKGCFNRHMLDAGDWNWCPDHKNTPKQFECSRLITGEMVIDCLKKNLDNSFC